MMPADARRGLRWSDHRMVVNGIMFRTGQGARGVTCGASTVTGRTPITGIAAGRWTGMWEKILDRLRAGCDEAEGPEWTLSADSTVIRAHQHSAGAWHVLPRSWSRGAPPK